MKLKAKNFAAESNRINRKRGFKINGIYSILKRLFKKLSMLVPRKPDLRTMLIKKNPKSV